MTIALPRRPFRIVGFSGNTHRPSKSRLLVETILAAVAARLPVETQAFDILDGGPDLTSAYARQGLPAHAERILMAIETADALVVASPVYKGSYTGHFKHVIDLLDQNALNERPVIVAATGGGHRHALVVEHQLRPLFGFFNALTVPTSVYASDREFADGRIVDPTVVARIESAAASLAQSLRAAVPAAEAVAA